MTKKDIKKDIMAVRDEVHRLQDEAAKNPDHPINDGLKKHFEEERQMRIIHFNFSMIDDHT